VVWNTKANFYETIAVIGITLLVAGITRSSWADEDSDFLYVGNGTDVNRMVRNSVVRFDAETGRFIGVFVTSGSGGLDGPRGLIFEGPIDRRPAREDDKRPRHLLIANQNVDQSFAGEILAYNAETGNFLRALVAHANMHAPFAPRGIVLSKALFVANDEGVASGSNGELQAFTHNGDFIDDLIPSNEIISRGFHPRSLVVGPDRLLYVSNDPVLGGLGGQILRFQPETRTFLDVFTSNVNYSDFNRPEGLAFGPDGNIYVTSFRRDAADTDKILIFAGPGSTKTHAGAFLGQIDLDKVSNNPQDRASAQALLFGPHGFLYVPIAGPGPDIMGNNIGYSTGEVRRYNVHSKKFNVFVLPRIQGGPLQEPWYLTFGNTDPATLNYQKRGEGLDD
jgi:hypothetical protein